MGTRYGSPLMQLPQELRDEIFSRLDAHSVMRLQSVCKALRAVETPTSDAFAPVAYLVAKGQRWIWTGYDPAAKLWKWLPSFSAAEDHPDTVLAASSNGLVCALVRGNAITVCNPLTREHRRLPPLTLPRCPDLLHILRDGRSDRYRVIASGGYSLVAGEIIRRTECYDSATNSWRATGNSPPGLRLQRYQTGVHANGLLYCLARGPELHNVLLAYHLESGAWVHNLTCDNHYAMNAQLVSCHDKVYYYEEFHIQGTRCKGFSIDELDLHTSRLQRVLVDHRPLCQSRGTVVAQAANQVCVYYPKEAKGMVYHLHVTLPPRREPLPRINPPGAHLCHLQPLPRPFELSFSASV